MFDSHSYYSWNKTAMNLLEYLCTILIRIKIKHFMCLILIPIMFLIKQLWIYYNTCSRFEEE